MRWADAFYNGIVSVVFTAGIYEICFNAVAAYVVLRTTDLVIEHLQILPYLLIGGWLVLGSRQARSFVLTKASAVLLSACLFAWIVWVVLGFHYNILGEPNLDLSGEILNVVTKATLPFGYALGLQPSKTSSNVLRLDGRSLRNGV